VKAERARLVSLAAASTGTFRAPCRIRKETFDVSFALHAERGRYWSTAILQRLEQSFDPGARVLGITTGDLYVPFSHFFLEKLNLAALARLFRLA